MTTVQRPNSSFFDTRRGRTLLENLNAYLFLLPASLIIFIFGIFPVAFAFLVSLHQWRRFPGDYEGLDSYVDALGGLAYVSFFWVAVGAFLYGIYGIYRLIRTAEDEPVGLLYFIPSAVLTTGLVVGVDWLSKLLLAIYEVPVRLRGQAVTRDSFIAEFFNSFTFTEVYTVANTMLGILAAGAVLTFIWMRLFKTEKSGHYLLRTLVIGVVFATGYALLRLTLNEVNAAIEAARAAEEDLPIWSQIVFISAGAGLLGFAVWLWQRTVHNPNASIMRLLVVVVAVVGAVFLIRELPPALAQADDDMLQGFSVTVMYSVFSVPLQLALGLVLAVLLFQNIKGKSFFRVVYFMPYITPFVATSVVFGLIFSHNVNSPVNQFLSLVGVETQNWLSEPTGIFELIFGEGIPTLLSGPSLALTVIILYNVWIYAGYSTVIFLAGLGNIPDDVYEAARIDGANAWHQFRHITLPLLSPTTFFLMLIATIGTFQAFTQIFLLRRPGAFDAVDTINLYIYEEITRDSPDYAYGTAMAFVLFAVILILTLVQNRVVGRRVFYG